MCHHRSSLNSHFSSSSDSWTPPPPRLLMKLSLRPPSSTPPPSVPPSPWTPHRLSAPHTQPSSSPARPPPPPPLTASTVEHRSPTPQQDLVLAEEALLQTGSFSAQVKNVFTFDVIVSATLFPPELYIYEVVNNETNTFFYPVCLCL